MQCNRTRAWWFGGVAEAAGAAGHALGEPVDALDLGVGDRSGQESRDRQPPGLDGAGQSRGATPRSAARSCHDLLLACVPVHVVAERLGHADPAITLRVYAHVLRQHAAGIADVFAAAIEPGDDATSAAVNDGVADPGAAVVLARP